ncbi:MAG: hypothetical protein RL238_412 [Actinomycetota bacterium]|jgi:polysaccharide pyruvyl transferase WcaK-like protein
MTHELLLIGDVGDDVYHVGDEAMFATALAELSARCDARITAVSASPDTITARYGVAAIPHIGFDRRVGSAYDSNRERRLDEVLDGSATDPAAVSLHSVVQRADAVLVCGGGNLASTWPHLLYERLALMGLAVRRGIPLVLVSQTIGPDINTRPAVRLGEFLDAAAFVGVRDQATAQLVRRLAPSARVLHHEDDAAQLPSVEPAAALPVRYVAFAVHGNSADDHALEQLVAFVSHLHDVSGLPVVMVPHTGTLNGPELPGTDADLMATVCKQLPDAEWLHALPVFESGASAAVLRGAAAVVSARFHPVVFALSDGVPCMALTSDCYTDIKLDGALSHHGTADWRLPLRVLGTGPAEALFSELWARRDELAAHVALGADERRAAHRARWDLVVRCLEGGAVAPSDLREPPEVVPCLPVTVDTRAALAWDHQIHELVAAHRSSADRAEEYALSLRDALDQEIAAHAADQQMAERNAALQQAELDAMRDELEQADRSAEAARELAGRLRAVLDHGPAVAPPTTDVAALQRELDAMRNTKLFRWTAPARNLYGRLRTSGSRRRS